MKMKRRSYYKFTMVLAAIVILMIAIVTLDAQRPVFSCDTWVAMPDATANGLMMMAKTSDVAYYECEPFVRWEGGKHEPGEMIDLQYQRIPQVERTYTVLGSSQFWIWGCEQGINEFGVAIGNEAVLTKEWRGNLNKVQNGEKVERGILGMNLVRLGLERGRTAREALEAMTPLIEKYGQWGSGIAGYSDSDGSFDNSYIIADGTEAWILETAGFQWIAKRVAKGVANIGNYPSIRTEWDLCSKDLIKNAVDKGWWPADKVDEFDFAIAYNDFEGPLAPNIIRGKRVKALLRQKEGQIDIRWMFRISRDHFEGSFLEGPYFNAAIPDFLTVCMHHSPAAFTWGITSGTNVSVLPGKDANVVPVTYWAANVPCCACFVPFYPNGSEMPEGVDKAGKSKNIQTDPTKTTVWGYVPDSYWWNFDKLRMLVNGDTRGEREEVIQFGFKYNERQPAVRAEFDKLEKDFIAGDWKVRMEAKRLLDKGQTGNAAKLLDGYSSKCSKRALSQCKTLVKYFESLER
jgi:secernin